MKKRIMILAALGLTLMLAGCGGETPPGEAEEKENAREDEVSGRGDSQESDQMEETNYNKMMVDENLTCQTREDISALLFDREKGIGLTCYRYNLGAGSAESKNGTSGPVSGARW